MAEVSTGDGGGEKGKPKKMQLRVDFTPMVDMNMLLITFFMFCTTLSKPQIMDITVPTKDNETLTEEDKNKVKESKAITILLGEDDKVYYYLGSPNYEDYTSLKVTDYSPEGGIRGLLLERNRETIEKMVDLKRQRVKKEIKEEEFKEKAAELRKSKDGPVVVIKATDAASYKNLVDALDEMQICSIGTYALVDIAEGDKFLIENYQKKGALSAEAAGVK